MLRYHFTKAFTISLNLDGWVSLKDKYFHQYTSHIQIFDDPDNIPALIHAATFCDHSHQRDQFWHGQKGSSMHRFLS